MTIFINAPRLRSLTAMIETAGEQHAEYKLEQDGNSGGWTLIVDADASAFGSWWRTAAACYSDTTAWTDDETTLRKRICTPVTIQQAAALLV